MVRVKKGVHAAKTRRNVLKQAKGFRNGRKNKEKLAYENLAHAGVNAYVSRKDKKGDFRRLWNVRINAALRSMGHNYSTFINGLKKKNILINRKMLSQMAQETPEVLEKLVKQIFSK